VPKSKKSLTDAMLILKLTKRTLTSTKFFAINTFPKRLTGKQTFAVKLYTKQNNQETTHRKP